MNVVLKTAPTLEPKKIGSVSINCDYCGNKFFIFPCHLRLRKHHFCKPDCYHGWLSKNRNGERHHNWKGGPVMVPCSQCGAGIFRTKAEIKEHKNHFCSKECDGKWRSENLRGSVIYNWKEAIKVSCDQCGVEILRKPGKITRYNHNFCSRSCKAKWHSENINGEKAYQWRGGIFALRERIRQDPKAQINGRMATGMGTSLKGRKRGQKWERLAGYSCEQLMEHLSKSMPKEYSWNDFLAGRLEIDHIIPQAAFNFTTERDVDFKRCWAMRNLRLLPVSENRRKGARLQRPFQPSLLLQVSL